MNRSFHPPKGALEIDTITLWGRFAVGSTGACTLSAANSKGIASVTRTGVGAYTITLSEATQKFLYGTCFIEHDNVDDPSSATAALIWRGVSNDVTSATPTWKIQFVATDDGVASEVASGATVYFKLELRNSSVG